MYLKVRFLEGLHTNDVDDVCVLTMLSNTTEGIVVDGVEDEVMRRMMIGNCFKAQVHCFCDSAW